jgi:hypothetical protein
LNKKNEELEKLKNEEVRKILLPKFTWKLKRTDINELVVFVLVFYGGSISNTTLWFIPVLLVGIFIFYVGKTKVNKNEV